MNLAKTPDRVRSPKKEKRTCQFAGCETVFWGHFVSKYCPDHQGTRIYKKHKPECGDDTNRVIKHGLNIATKAYLYCEHPSCKEAYPVLFIPKVNVFPKYCPYHTPKHRRRSMNLADVAIQAKAEVVDSNSISHEVIDIPITPVIPEEIEAADSADIFAAAMASFNEKAGDIVVSAFDDDDDVISVVPCSVDGPAAVSNPDYDVVKTDGPGPVFTMPPMSTDPVISSEHMTAAPVTALAGTEKGFDPKTTGSILDPVSDDDAGMVRASQRALRSVLADGRGVEFSRVSSTEFPFELQGFKARVQNGAFMSEVQVNDFFRTMEDAMNTVTSDDNRIYYRCGATDSVVGEGAPEIVSNDIVCRRYVNDAWIRA